MTPFIFVKVQLQFIIIYEHIDFESLVPFFIASLTLGLSPDKSAYYSASSCLLQSTQKINNKSHNNGHQTIKKTISEGFLKNGSIFKQQSDSE